MKRYSILSLVAALALLAGCNDNPVSSEERDSQAVAEIPQGKRPDHHSSPINAVTVTPGNGSVSATWSPSTINRNESDQYVVNLDRCSDDACTSSTLVENVNTGSTRSYSKSGLAAGKYRLRVTGHNGGGANNVVWSNWSVFTVTATPDEPPAKQTQSVTITAPISAVYGDHDLAVSASATSSLPITFSLVSGPCTVTAAGLSDANYKATVSITGAGDCVFKAEQAGNELWDKAGAEAKIVVAKADPVIDITSVGPFTYDAQAHAATVTVKGVAGVDLAHTVEYYEGEAKLDGAPTNAGTYTVKVIYAGSENYNAASPTASLVINKADPSITITAAGGTYNGQPYKATVTVKGVAGVDLAHTVEYYEGETKLDGAPTNAGAYTVKVSYPGSLNYNSAADDKSFVVAARPIIVKAVDAAMILGGALPAFSASYGPVLGNANSGFAPDENETTLGTSGLTFTPTAAPTIAGSYPIVPSGLAGWDNYAIEYVEGKLAVRYHENSYKFLQPINAPGQPISAFKYGSAIPVKFQLFDASGSPIHVSRLAATPTIKVVNRGTSTQPSELETYVLSTNGDTGNSFRWDDQLQGFIFNLSTKPWTAGNAYDIVAVLDGGEMIVARVTSKK